ncbi:MAG TPA: phospholipase D-like domain-containing protein [Gemmatimonadales bacterium]|jgi:phosphatidylserine/phosphatidylglycerophosphate/cardiolipin synthase-like enzyme|nr:phospholipase D-like domain-containing protein [Gemmatimonadales bacterium]
MKLLVQPDDGVGPVLEAIERAETSLDLYVFRLTHPKLKRALGDAVSRGVVVRALIAHVTADGSEGLRKLESELLGMGVTVSRTAEDLIRYHGKVLIKDRTNVYILGYNLTRRDIAHARSFGIATRQKSLVAEAIRLFEADFDRQLYTPRLDQFVVSPFNSRASILSLIEEAREQLLIYEPRLTDRLIQKALEQRAMAGINVRIISKVAKNANAVQVAAYPGERMHVRAIVQDSRRVFIGSQGLRRAELDRRREVGVIVDDKDVVRGVTRIFEKDWAETPLAKGGRKAKAAKA